MWFLIAWLCVGYLSIFLLVYNIGVLHLDQVPFVALAGLLGPIMVLFAIAWFTDEHRVIWRRKK